MDKIPPIVKTYTMPSNWAHINTKEITLHIPNVRYAKEHDLLKTARPMPMEIMIYNMEICGFDIVTYGEHQGNKTKITTKCCNINCDNTSQKPYKTYITEERLPLCESCNSIVRRMNMNDPQKIVAINNDEKIIFNSSAEASKKLNIAPQQVYNHLKRGTPHKSGYRFEYLD